MKYANVEWKKAACAGLDTSKFYDIEDRATEQEIHEFRATCMKCPIWEACLKYAWCNEDYGMWGGMTTRERDLFRGKSSDYHHNWNKLRLSLHAYGISIFNVHEIYNDFRGVIKNARPRQTT